MDFISHTLSVFSFLLVVYLSFRRDRDVRSIRAAIDTQRRDIDRIVDALMSKQTVDEEFYTRLENSLTYPPED